MIVEIIYETFSLCLFRVDNWELFVSKSNFTDIIKSGDPERILGYGVVRNASFSLRAVTLGSILGNAIVEWYNNIEL